MRKRESILSLICISTSKIFKSELRKLFVFNKMLFEFVLKQLALDVSIKSMKRPK